MSTLASTADRNAVQGQSDPAAIARAPEGKQRKKPEVSIAMMFSMALHLGLAVLLITHSVSKGVRKPQPRTAVVISLDAFRESGKPRAPHVETVPPSQQPLPKMNAAPPPDAQAVPRPKHAPAPPKPAQTAVPQPQTQTRAPALQPRQSQLPTPLQKRGDEGESIGITVLNRVRTNWLRPVGSSLSFHCRLRIDYQAGGFIANVVILDGCGNNPLDDSVERAVWKTQPLPLDPAQNGPGSMVLEFTP